MRGSCQYFAIVGLSDMRVLFTALVLVAVASTGAARAINPYHTNGDGDSTFAVSTNRVKSDLGISVVGALAADLVSEAILRAVRAARSVEGWPACGDLNLGSRE